MIDKDIRSLLLSNSVNEKTKRRLLLLNVASVIAAIGETWQELIKISGTQKIQEEIKSLLAEAREIALANSNGVPIESLLERLDDLGQRIDNFSSKFSEI